MLSYKIATYISLTVFIGVSVIFLVMSNDLAHLQPNQIISPATFPRIVSILLIITCFISFFTTIRKKDEKVEFTNFPLVIYTILAILVFLILWQMVGYFFIFSFLMLAFLFFIYSKQEVFLKKMITSISLSLVVVLFNYIVFAQLLGVIF